MTRPRFLYAVLPALLLASGCSSVTEPEVTLWEGNVTAVAPATVTGVVAAVSQFGRTQISIQIRQAEDGGNYAWRVETGSCQNPGTLQGGAALYPLLVVTGPALTADADATIPGQFSSGGAYIARVIQLGEVGAETVVACGSLLETS
ncbi:MAG TPA: hypothetical protein VLA43_05550 [Longimicrobiales bacterium]|nr:hypothetical protein [Longimicrobiales bacterium]